MKENECRDKNNILYHYFQMTEDKIDKPKTWPDWLKQLSVYIPKDRKVRVTTESPNKSELKDVKPGDYILRNDTGVTKLVSPEEFERFT